MATSVKNALANKANNNVAASEEKSLKQMIQVMQPQIEKALPSVITADRFTRIVTTALSTNPKLANCTQPSFLGAMMQAAQLGLEPNTPLGQAYLIPYGNQCQFQIGYKGLIDLAYRSGEFKTINAKTVYENDEFEYGYGLEPTLIHKPAKANRGNPICYYGVFTLVNGGFGFEVMSVDEVKAHRRKFSKAKNSPWDTDFDEMAKKTVLKKALKYAPIKTDFARQLSADETVKEVADGNTDVLDEKDRTIWAEVEVVGEETVKEETIPTDELPFTLE